MSNQSLSFPDAESIEAVVESVEFPEFVDVQYEPPTPAVDDVESTARREVNALPLDQLPDGASVAVGLGSRGIHDIVTIAKTTIEELNRRGFEPFVIPAMGSHGGATAEGQRETLAALGLTEETLGCPIDARMETVSLGESTLGREVHFSAAALEADATMVVNRIKSHTNFDGEIESGLSKMTAVGLGKQPGAKRVHEQALTAGYVSAIRTAVEVIERETNFLGGVAIVENFYDHTAVIEGIPAAALAEREPKLLERAEEYMPTLPYDDIDVLVIDEIGKNISGTGMDTNIIGRYRVLNTDDPEVPEVRRIFVRGLTEETHGNGHGIGLADITTVDVLERLDLEQMYANALTSGSLSKDALPLGLPDERLALTAAVTSMGAYDPETVKVAWIQDTSHLSSFKVSTGLAADDAENVELGARSRLTFENGEAAFEPVR